MPLYRHHIYGKKETKIKATLEILTACPGFLTPIVSSL